MREIPRAQDIYKHFKGNVYQIIAVATHTETDEDLVIYQAMYGDFKIYARPLAMFLEKVDREKYPDAVQEYRFEKVTAGLQSMEQAKENESFFALGQETPEAATQDQPAEDGLDPLMSQFLDASTHEERLRILSTLHPRITKQMLLTMAIVVGVELKSKEEQEQYEELKACLVTLDRYEIQR